MKRIRSAVVLAMSGALVLSACGGGDGSNPASNPAGGGKAVVGSWGGDYQNYLKEYVEPALGGDTQVVYDTGDAEPRMTKLRTEKDSAEGSTDVALLGDSDMQGMIEADVMEKLDLSQIPNAANIQDALTNDYWIPHIFSANVLIYNSEQVTPAPDSYDVMWDPKYKGKIGVLSDQWFNFYFAAAAVVKGGNPGNDVDAGWEKLLELKDSVVVFASQEQLGQAMMSGQIWLTANWKARAFQWSQQEGGAPLASVVPKEGTFPVTFAAGIPKNAVDKDAAYAYLNAMLDPKAQASFAENMGYSPTVSNAELPGDLQTQIGFTEEEQAQVNPLDFSYIVENNERWREQWQQQIVAG